MKCSSIYRIITWIQILKRIKGKRRYRSLRKTKLFIKIICVLILILSTALLSACSASTSDSTGKYVVLIGEDSEITEKLSDIDLLVIDAEYFSQNDIARLRENGVREIYSYIMIQTLRNIHWALMRKKKKKNGSMSRLRNGRHVQLPE